MRRDKIAALLSRLSSFKRLGILSCSANSPRHIPRSTSPRGSAKTVRLRLRHGLSPCLSAGKCVSLGCPKCLDEGTAAPARKGMKRFDVKKFHPLVYRVHPRFQSILFPLPRFRTLDRVPSVDHCVPSWFFFFDIDQRFQSTFLPFLSFDFEREPEKTRDYCEKN